MPKIQRALISVTDKAGIDGLGRALAGFGVKILSTGGTARALLKQGSRSERSPTSRSFPMLDSRGQTLILKSTAAYSRIRSRPEHVRYGRTWIFHRYGRGKSLTFEKTVARPCTPESNRDIDIGGPTLLRARRRNYPFVTVC
jgi:phosphoribosylaminoimidazolecarboxamide formyltransferase/IMP cyclohydrolase